MGDMDQGIKRLIQLFPAELIAFAKEGMEYVSPAPVDVAMERQLVLDTLFRAQYHHLPCLVNLEAQTVISQEAIRRFVEYAERAKAIYHLPVISVILWLKAGRNVPQPPYEEWLDDYLVSSHNFINIEIYRLSAHVILTSGPPSLWPLIPLMADADEATDIAAMEAIARQLPREQQQGASELLAVFIARQFDNADLAREIYRRVHMSTELLEESPLYREWIAQAEAKGEAKGKVEGEARGKADGELSGLRRSVRIILAKRFGPLDETLLAAIDAAQAADLEAVLAQAITDTLDQIRARLQQPQP